MGVRRLVLAGIIPFLAVACTGGSPSPAPHSTGSAAFSLREVLGPTSLPFTRGVIKPDDPFRSDPSFKETPPAPDGSLVSYLDIDTNGDYSPSRDEKLRLGPVLLDGTDAESATPVDNSQPSEGQQAGWYVDVRLTPDGARRFAQITRRLVGRQLAVVLDDVVLSAPTVASPITNGRLQVTGRFTFTLVLEIALEIVPPG